MKHFLSLTALLLAGLPASLAGTFTGTFSGTFSDPILSGTILDIYGNPVFSNNTFTHVSTGFPGSVVTWGTYPTDTFPLTPGCAGVQHA
jgi:ABC-type dipeptide/oligopeptide/nickel transport system permease component